MPMTDSETDLTPLLARISMFSELRPEQLAQLAAQSRCRSLARSEVLFQRGDPCHGFYYVIRGQVKLAFSSSQGNEKVVEIIGAGNTFGEAVMFLDRPYPVFAEALVHTELLRVGQAAVFGLLETDPSFARGMLAGMAIRLHTLIRDVESYSLSNATQRVIGYLLQEAHGQDADGAAGPHSIRLVASKQVIASRLSLTPETFSRTLHVLAEAGLIAVDGRSIELLDLQRLANHDP